MWRATLLATKPWPTQSAKTTRATSSVQEKTAERSPPESEPEGTAITSASRPASSMERWAFSLPAQSSMQPKGRAALVVHSKASTFLNFICGPGLIARNYRPDACCFSRSLN